MKAKFLIPIICSIVVGFLLGGIFFKEYNANSISVFNEGRSLYFVELGVYKDMNSLKKNFKDYDNYLLLFEEDGYHIYAAITNLEKTKEKIKVYYEKKGNNVYIREKKVKDEAFLTILDEYDKITTITTNDKDLLSIEKIVLSNYEEMVLQNEFND